MTARNRRKPHLTGADWRKTGANLARSPRRETMHHGPEAVPGRRFASAEALALYRLNALDAGVKGALEHGLA